MAFAKEVVKKFLEIGRDVSWGSRCTNREIDIATNAGDTFDDDPSSTKRKQKKPSPDRRWDIQEPKIHAQMLPFKGLKIYYHQNEYGEKPYKNRMILAGTGHPSERCYRWGAYLGHPANAQNRIKGVPEPFYPMNVDQVSNNKACFERQKESSGPPTPPKFS
jgi:hypothetical protein